ncbi:bifunctional DNA-formamidopyrimidine glycosylase/DNA-(apurinic or apyrimidinic site) lyase [Staphylococcus argensis]|uniref:Formamidopyrimidine-DNA glycosylase n=1 Tax=Staphylococcus argensis TaxID=1607738 RepID=A0A2K4FFU4_9STAP|nr:bifunctional DNA-formamidopyrimidine glycosylase/DNA-(apurinic or apyrimidinic site) lyase [Staphylococcus argensis]MCY6990689.1 bifunctional DNA-formamidopyrimidine glycosylase/DNA-(apurinic or apyrimidinic site) lyase [Staphylococcus argensis]POA10191.1 DNA-formamidopyrimidine glycosylase [Staphylococcus argensis]
MPELPEVEHVKRGIVPDVESTTIQSVTFSEAVKLGKKNQRETIIKGLELDTFKTFTEGYKINQIERRSKYIYFYLEREDDQRILVSHLGMAGGFFVVNELDEIRDKNYRKHWHVIFNLDNDKMLVYSDIRRFGEIRNLPELAAYPSLLEIAPEPFDDDALDHYLAYFNERKFYNKPIKAMILDHRVIAGCGNIYACEALFRAGIHPARKADSLTLQERKMLFYYIREVLEEGIRYGGTSISDYRHADGRRGEMQNRLNVYKQDTCKVCGTPIERQVIATRNSHFCPECQS